MILDSNEQLQQQLEYILLKPDYHCWWISKLQSDSLEERYVIKFCFKLGKNATETYGMLQTGFGTSCMNRASVFELHKRFKESKESVRGDERYVRSKEVRTPESIGQIKISWIRTAGRWSSWAIQIPQFLMLWWPVMKAGSTAMTQRPRRPDRANPPTNFWWSLFWQYWHDLHALGSHWTDSQQGILWGFKGVQQEIPSEEASTLQIGSVAFPPGQCTSQQLYPCHRLFDQDGHQECSSPFL